MVGLLPLLFVGCVSSPDDKPDSGAVASVSSPTAATGVGTTAVGLTPPGTGSGAPTGGSTPQLTSEPVIAHPDPGVGLARVLELELTAPVAVRVALDDGATRRELAFSDVASAHRLPLLGLTPSTAYTVDITTDPPGGDASLAFETAPIPDDFPVFDLLVHDEARSEPGWTLLAPKSGDLAFMIVLDEQLQPAWYYRQPGGMTDVRVGPHGDFWATGSAGVIRISPAEGKRASWGPIEGDADAVEVDVLSLHHSVVPQADGSFWALSYGSFEAADHPQSYNPSDPLGRQRVADVEVVHVLPDGEVAERLGLADVLDRRRLAWDALDEQRDFGVDWCHGNALELDLSRRVALVGMRHQDAVIELDLDTGEPNWILANASGWTPALDEHRLQATGPLSWPFHPHAPKWGVDDSILMFDNRNVLNTPYDGAQEQGTASRIVRYAVDAARMQVQEVWSYDETLTGTLLAETMGDADDLPLTGNVLATFGNLKGEAELANPSRGWGDASARIIEVDPELPESPALDLRVRSERSLNRRGWNVYRSERIPAGLYPEGTLVD